MARVLIVGGGCRGRLLARELVCGGHAVRITTRGERGREAIEAAGAECWVGTPAEIGTLRYALEDVTVLCWLLGTAAAGEERAPLHGSRLQMMLSTAIDTTVRGVIYEAAGSGDRHLLAGGAAIVAQAARRSGVPFALIEADPDDTPAWLVSARAALAVILGGRAGGESSRIPKLL